MSVIFSYTRNLYIPYKHDSHIICTLDPVNT